MATLKKRLSFRNICKEKQRLNEIKDGSGANWRNWGPYLSERSWGTVREDYSEDGNAWGYLSHDASRSKSYRWGEDGIAGISDKYQVLNWSLGLWNGKDPILKERLFGVTPYEGNHGEDVKEYYFYLDSTPTHSYMKYLYKYPQAEYPYKELVEKNREKGGQGTEYELLDTGIFDEDKYFDVFVEFAKVNAEDICIRIEAFNRGPDDADLHIIPQYWYRNIWKGNREGMDEPCIRAGKDGLNHVMLLADDSESSCIENLPFEYRLGLRRLYGDLDGAVLFTDNESNNDLLYGKGHNRGTTKYHKDGFHRYIVDGEPAVNPHQTGTKSCIHYERRVKAGGSTVIKLRLTREHIENPLEDIDRIMMNRINDADEFYDSIHPKNASDDEKSIQRQAFAGLLWTKQCYFFDVKRWLEGDDKNNPPPASRYHIRNQHWQHVNTMSILSMPDKWEYPWFAAWDLGFHAIPICLVDPEFAKEQLLLMLVEQFQHPNGQIPAYEWEFSDLNPPVHAWAVWRVYNMDRIRSGKADRSFLEKCFHKLMLNFTWWVNKVDKEGNNVFEGGFLGLDNITIFDRSEKLGEGTVLEQSDATGWMGMYCLNLMRIALELAKENSIYEGLATKFYQHYTYVGAAMQKMNTRDYNLWDNEDGFFYDLLRHKDGSSEKLRVRSLVGLVPIFAVERLEERWLEPFTEFRENLDWYLHNRLDVVETCVSQVEVDGMDIHVLTIVDQDKIARIMERLWDKDEFRSDFGLRSMSKHHLKHPFILGHNRVDYEPAEAECKIKGGNSNWRGPIWFPTTFLMIESLRKLCKAYGKSINIKDDSGDTVYLSDVAQGMANDLISIFTRDEEGRRPVYAKNKKFQTDPYWCDYILFYEYFNGDTGEGLGASHQTGWSGLVASLIDEWRS
jgi:hypothetical protein